MSEDSFNELLREVRAALTSEDEVAHGEAVKEGPDGYIGLGVCAYDDQVLIHFGPRP